MAAKNGARENLPRSAAGPNNPWLIAVIVSIATFMEVLDTTIANVALRNIAGSLAASQDESTYILTSYLVANAIILPISGWLANVIGRKRFYMGCVALFTISSALCALSTSIWMMIVFRVLQGFGGGGLAPVEQSIFADTFPPAKRAIAFSLYGLTVVTAPAIGPVLGGLITDNLSWHWVFLINLPFGLVSLTLTYLFVSDSEQTMKDRRELFAKGLKVDYVGFALIFFGIGALQIALDRFEPDDGFSSTFVFVMIVISVTCVVSLLVWEWFHPQPLINLRLLKSRAFAVSNIVLFVFGFVFNATTQIIPQMTQMLMGYDATKAGLTLGLGGVISVIVMPIAGMLPGKVVQPRWLVLAALVGIAYSMYYSMGLNVTMDFFTVSWSRALQVFWLPFIFIPLSAVQFVGVPENKNNEASAILNFVRNLGGSVGIAVAATELAWRTQFHHERLAEHVGAFSGFGPGHSLNAIGAAVQVQATILSYLDVFTVLAVITVVVIPLALFLPNMPKGAAAGG